MKERIPMIKLSILICTVPNRKKELDRLLKVLEVQMVPEVEVLTFSDNFEWSIGEKRNELVKDASGEYVAFIDDDDLVSYDYISSILKATKDNPDVIGITGIITTNGKNPKKFIHSATVKEWCEKDGIYYRCPNHLNPVKRSLAIQVPFPSKCYGEDKDYSLKLLPLLNTEIEINHPIYFYLFDDTKSEAAKRK